MRLTLRTLLAYLDDILEPAQANEIGKKLQNAPVAQELVTRIREVVRRRRLKAPTLTGPEAGLDPNMVAEYIDNQQTPAQVTQTERILLSSDVHLAETASAHQILTLVLGEPVEVLPNSRNRMYALGPVAPTDQLQVPAEKNETADAPSNSKSVAVKLAESSGSGIEKRPINIPATSTLKKATPTVVSAPAVPGERRWPAAAVAILAFVWLGLQFGDSDGRPKPQSESLKVNKVPAVTQNEPAEPTSDEGSPSVPAEQLSEPVVAVEPRDTTDPSMITTNEPPAPTAIDAPPPPDADEPTAPGEGAVEITTLPAPGNAKPTPSLPGPDTPSEDETMSSSTVAAPEVANGATTESSATNPADANPAEAAIANAAPATEANSAMPAEPAKAEPTEPKADESVATNAPPVPGDPENMITEPMAGDTTAVSTGLQPPANKKNVIDIGPPPEMTGPATPLATGDGTGEIAADAAVPTELPKAPDAGTAAMSYVQGTNGVLLQHHDDHWFAVPADYGIAINTRLASPQPYLAELTMANLPVRLHLAGGSRLKVLEPRNGMFTVQMETGRAIFTRPADEPAGTFQGKPVSVIVVVGAKSWTITIPAAESRFAIQATPVPPVRLETLTDGYAFKVWAIGSLGNVTVQAEGGEEKPVAADARLTLAAPEPGKVLAEPGVAVEWLAGGEDPVAKWLEGPVAPTDKRDAGRFGKELDPTGPVSDSLPSLVESSKSWMSRRAAQCLSLTENYQSLVRTLAISEHDETTAEAIHGLRMWLACGPDRGPMLKKELDHEFPTEDADALYRLLWGFDETHARDMQTSRELVRWLSSNRPVIQRLAYFHILRVTGTQDSYRVSLTRDRLNSFRKKWQRQIQRGDGKLLDD